MGILYSSAPSSRSGLFVYLLFAMLTAGEVLVTANAILQLVLYCVLLVAVVKPLGGYMARVYEGEAKIAQKVLGPLERLIYRVLRVDSKEEMTWKTYAIAVMLFNLAGFLVVYLLQRLAGLAAGEPAALAAVTPDSSFNTAVSFATNTNWQGYGGETTLSYLTQMLGLTVQNFVSAATGMAVLVALIRGFSRKTTSDARQLLGRSRADARSTSSLPLSIVGRHRPRLAGRRADVRRVRARRRCSRRRRTPTARRSPIRSSRSVPPRRRSSSSSSAPTAAASSTSTPRIRSRTRRRSRTSSRCSRSSMIPAALCYTFGKMVGDTRQGWAVLAAMFVIFVPLLWLCVSQEQGQQPRARVASRRSRRERAPGRRQHGGQGGPLRHRQLGALGDGHDRGLERLGQRDARLVHAARRPRADVAHAARRDRLRRRRLRALRHAHVRHRRRLRRRSHGRPHARVPRQEDRGLRDEDGLARHPDPAARSSSSAPPSRASTEAGQKGVANPAAHGFSEILYAFSSAANNNGSAFAGLSANTPFYNTLARHLHVVRALLAHRADARHRRLAREEEARARQRAARCRRTRRSSSRCSSAPSSSSARSRSSRRSRSGPIVEHLLAHGA